MPETTWIDSGKTEAPGKVDTALGWIRNNRDTFIGSVVILLAAAIFGVYFFMHYRDLREAAWKNLFIAQQTGFGGNVPQAMTMLGEVETTYGNTSAAQFALMTKGDMLFAQDKFNEAAAEYAKLTEDKKVGPFAIYNLGKCKEAAGDLAGAQARYSDLLTRYPEHYIAPEAHFSLARAQELAGQLDLAKASYEKVMLLYPETSWAGQAKERLTAAEGKPQQPAAPAAAQPKK